MASSISVTAEGDTVVMIDVLLSRSVAVAVGGVPGLGGDRDGRAGGHGELCRAYDVAVLEIEEEPVGPGAGHLGHELDLRAGHGAPVAGAAVGVDVEVGE